MRSAVALRHVGFEDVGAFAQPLAAFGYGLVYREVGVDAFDADESCELLIVLGGPIGVYDTALYPFLDPEIALVRRRLAARQPVLGICLGAQIMARALGVAVYAGAAKEIGWAPVSLTPEGASGPLRHLADTSVLHWHGDTFDLPEGATLLASTPQTAHQAFRVGDHALGLQFHPEQDGTGFERWLIGHACEIGGVAGLSVTELRRDAQRYGAAAGQAGAACLRDWLAQLER